MIALRLIIGRPVLRWLTHVVACCALVGPAAAAEYFVGPDGSDDAQGVSVQTPLKTIQKAVGRLRPGDTLTLLPGEYMQRFAVRQQASADRPITIRAAIPGFSVIRGDVAFGGGFEKVAGTRFVWAARSERWVYRIFELDTRVVYLEAPDLRDMDQFRPSCLYDRRSKTLYVHTSDGQSPSNHVIMGTVLPGHGIEVSGEYIHLEGLVISGFFPPSCHDAGRGFGLSLKGGHHQVRDCTFLYNGGGICVNANDCVLRDNLLIGNLDPNYGELAQIYVTGSSENVETINNVVLDAQTHGIRYYGQPTGARVIGNIVRNACIGLYLKASSGQRVVERNVVVGCSYIHFGAGEGQAPLTENANTFQEPSFWNEVQPAPGLATLRFDAAKQDPHFADPDHLDYRLQADSPLRSTKAGVRLGAYPFEPTVFFVGPAGNDNADGLSVAAAFRTIGRAVKQLRPGVTLYILPGGYEDTVRPPVSGTSDAPVVIRGHGRTALVEVGGLDLTDRSDVCIENLRIKNSVIIQRAANIRLERCTMIGLAGPAVTVQNSRNIWLRRLTIWNTAGTAVKLKGQNQRLRITSSILHSRNDVALQSETYDRGEMFFEYNDYLSASQQPLAGIAGAACPNLTDLRAATGADRYSFSCDPQFVELDRSAAIAAASCCTGAGELADNVGAGETRTVSPAATITEIKLRDLTPTSASITWWTPRTSNATWRAPLPWYDAFPVNSEVRYGASPDALTRTVHSFGDLYHRVTLHDLKPDTAYVFKIVVPDRPRADSLYQPYGPIEAPPGWTTAESQAFTFKTPAMTDWKPTRRVFYVSPDGRPGNTGLAENGPTTLTAVSDRVRAGDTVILLDGVYGETFAPAATGTPDAPITLRVQHPGRACLDGRDSLRPTAIALFWKNHVAIDGVVIRRFADKAYGDRAGFCYAQVFLARCEDVTLMNCVLAGWGSSGYGLGIVARGGDRLNISNCVLTGFVSAVVGRQNGLVNLLGNTWYVPRIINFELAGKVVVKNNLFFGQEKQKVFGYVPMVSSNKPAESDYNAFYLGPDNPVHYIGYGIKRNGEKDMGGVARVQKELGLDLHSFEPSPEDVRFRGPVPVDYLDVQALSTFRRAVRDGHLIPTLEMFDPPPDSRLNRAGEGGAPIGARSAARQ